MKRIKALLLTCLWIAGLLCPAAPLSGQEQRVEKGRDHPLLSRFPGSTIIRHSSMDFDRLVVPLGKATGIDEFEASESVEGKITRLTYEMPQGHSSLEVLQSYQEALVKNDFDILYECALDECGPHLNFQNLERPFIIARNHRYLAARGSLPENEVYVTARVYTTARQNPPLRAMISIAELKPMKQDLVRVNAEAMARAINETGRIALYGIHFDTDKTHIKPASEPTLQEMARFLSENRQSRVYIVGHTDNVGDLRYNLDLSQRRAEAVVKALTGSYGIDRNRIVAKGAGPFAPVASNNTEEGRAMNRRVELVGQ